ncbi:uncharacterized protein N7515_008083 [Penicillium bovifimosum]|uniref:Rhodopsin domain-containing protein n=1 Tax=Penicillium bovifimosum TaxID=126998 RepID=A0A9W9GMJ5_9EURO|nr:uncharacterized protein N7515_008083 [Penicillium bovifimosum]KAJ5124258.1 hypothetical protein N7515_008083 [Penicillium bovifimosum]
MYVLAVTAAFTGLAAIVTGLRLYTRFFLVKAPGLDDAMLVAALVCSCVFTALVIVERHYGLGTSGSDLAADTISKQLFYLWLSIPFYNLALIFAKLSALALFRRVFHARHLLPVVYALMGFLVIAGLWMTLSGFFFCIPIDQFWNPVEHVRRAHCLPEGPVWFVNAGIQVATDLVILGLPMPLLWHLNLPRRQKWGIMVVFSLGIFIVATSVTRMYQLSKMVRHGDFTRTNAAAAVWSSLEANVSIICVCLPPLNPLISRILSYCFLPQPISSPASKQQTRTTNSTDNTRPDGFIWYNNLFYPEQAGYSASISKVNTNEDGHDRGHPHGPDDDHGIRVVRELRMQSDSVCTSPMAPGVNAQDYFAHPGSNFGNDVVTSPRSQPSIEWDLGDFEFPDYKGRMNAPVGRE